MVKALVLGDLMLDKYTTGKVRRISPEAPVPVLEVKAEESRPGGAGNVALNLRALEADVTMIGRIGADTAGKVLEEKLGTLYIEENYQTPVKNRIIADSQQLLRIDFEVVTKIGKSLEEKVLADLEKHIRASDIVAISDYGKGFLSEAILERTFSLCKKHNIPSIVDPKGLDFTKYRGCTILKPNLSEAAAAAKRSIATPLEEIAAELLSYTESLLITRSEEGISLFTPLGRSDFPVTCHEVKDVTGAGDTVLATLCHALASGHTLAHAAHLSNIAASIAIERVGCAQITLGELLARQKEMALF